MNPCRLEILQALPGRVRIKIKGLKGNPHFAKSLEKTLKRNQGIKKIKANFQTGKALIIFNPQKLSRDELCVELMKNINYILQLVSPAHFKRHKSTYVRKKGKNEILKTIEELNKHHSLGIIHITHDMGEAARANRIIVMNEGRIIADGIPRLIFSNADKLEEIGLKLPRITELANALANKGIPLPKGITNYNELVDELCKSDLKM